MRLAEKVRDAGGQVSGSVRRAEKANALQAQGISALLYDAGQAPNDAMRKALTDATHILISVPPTETGCPIAALFEEYAMELPNLTWLGYFSSTGVYGDAGGEWVDETTPAAPISERGKRRATAEQQWLGLSEKNSVPSHVFRLSGIYGPEPGRNIFSRIEQGKVQHIYAPGHYISRIHVDDIAQAVLASMTQPTPGEIYNLADDAPSPTHEVTEDAYQLLGQTLPPRVSVQDAELSDFAASMYAVNKRVCSAKVKRTLNIVWYYPSIRDGLRAIHQALPKQPA